MTHDSPRRRSPVLDVHGAFLRRTNLSGASLRNANLSHADFSRALFKGADFKGARLNGTVLRGADLSDAINLTVEQIESAIIDRDTILPSYMNRQTLSAGAEISKRPNAPPDLLSTPGP